MEMCLWRTQKKSNSYKAEIITIIIHIVLNVVYK